MKIVTLAILLTAGILPMTNTGNMNNPHKIIEDMSWLAGSWRGDFEGNEFETHYSTPRGGVIISVSKEFSSDTASSCFFEFEKFEVKGDSVYLTPYPNGKMSDSFAMVDYNSQAKKAVFENKNHDFPTKFIYHMVALDSMEISVIGPSKDKMLELKLHLKRISHEDK